MSKLDELRADVCKVDAEIIALFTNRQRLILEIGLYKKEHSLPVFDPEREALLHELHNNEALRNNISKNMVAKVFDILIEESRKAQQNEQ